MNEIKWILNENFSTKNQYIKELGSGGFANVYLFENLKTSHQYAVKILQHTDKSVNNEVEILQRLQHGPGILYLHDYFIVRNKSNQLCFALLLDLLPGRDLFCFCRDNMDRIADDTIDSHTYELIDFMLLSTLNALIFMHRKNIAHRDIKPENLRIVDESVGKIVVMDYGLACHFDEADHTQTDLSKLVGTKCYTVPRDMLVSDSRTKKMVISADVYATGMTFQLLVDGRPANMCKSENKDTWGEEIENFDRGPNPFTQEYFNYINLCWEMIAPNTSERPTAQQAYDQLYNELKRRKKII